MKDDTLYLIHISECIQRIESYLEGINRKAFLASTLVQDAVLRNLQVMAESTQHLSQATKQDQNEIEWHNISGFRNVLVHDYLGVDIERIWDIIEKELPPLKEAVRNMLP